MNGLTQAYLGDGVFELYVREYLIHKGVTKINDLHKSAVLFTNAKAQSRVMEILINELSEIELIEFKRGRNSNAKQAKKTATIKEYKYATGLESLFGYLYLNDRERSIALFAKIVELIEG